jgi:hypothetical protein
MERLHISPREPAHEGERLGGRSEVQCFRVDLRHEPRGDVVADQAGERLLQVEWLAYAADADAAVLPSLGGASSLGVGPYRRPLLRWSMSPERHCAIIAIDEEVGRWPS